jgi:hypothetical protein
MNIPLGGGRRLVLAGMAGGWLWLVAGAVALGLLLVLYRYERRLVAPRTGLALLTLRVAAALALVASLFEPVAERVVREAVRGRVVVGVDLSESMATSDAAGGTATRREAARRLLLGDAIQSLRSAQAVESYGFAREAIPGTPEALADALARPSTPVAVSAQTTDWEPVLERALAEKDQAPVLGVVLLTDGRENGPPVAHPASERLRERRIPVFPVLIGSTKAPLDAAIAAVKAPETADRGQTARVDVTVKADGLTAGTEVPVTLERAGGSPMRQTVRAQADGGRPVVTFRVPLENPGEHELAVAVGPVDADARPDNDRRTFKVVVVDDKAKVLIVDGEARWEFQYLRNALQRDRRVTLEAVVLRQPATSAAFYATALPARPDPPADPEDSPAPDPLGAFDAIIVGDVGPDGLSAEAWGRLDAYVAERGGTLVLAAGPRTFPALEESEPVGRLLPLRALRVVPVDPGATAADRPALPAGVLALPTPAAAAGPWPMLQFDDDPERSLAAWSALPRLSWALAGAPKPSATALATVGGSADEGDAVMMAAMPYGLGKVFWVGTDGTWRWRYRIGDAYHHRFWGQVVQWATRGKLAAGNRLVQFGPVSPRVADGQPAVIRARFVDDVDRSLLVAARLFRAKDKATGSIAEPLAVVTLRPKPDQPRVFEAVAPALPPGPYVVRLDVPRMAEAMRSEGPEPTAALEVVPRDTPERVELAASRDALDRLATATGGKVLLEGEAGTLPELLRQRTVVRTRVDPTRLGERPESLILFFALLTGEWVLRKRAGLP